MLALATLEQLGIDIIAVGYHLGRRTIVFLFITIDGDTNFLVIHMKTNVKLAIIVVCHNYRLFLFG